MQQRILKSIHATLVTRIEFEDTGRYLTEDERKSLLAVAERHAPVLDLRRAGLTPQDINYLEFVRWTLQKS